MKNQINFISDNGTDIFIEVEDIAFAQTAKRGVSSDAERGVVQKANQSFSKALKPLKEISGSVIDCVKDFTNSPDDVEVELGLKFTAKAGIVLTSLDSEAHLKIVLKWHKKED